MQGRSQFKSVNLKQNTPTSSNRKLGLKNRLFVSLKSLNLNVDST